MPEEPISSWLPRKLKNAIKKCVCPHCHSSLDSSKVEAIGFKKWKKNRLMLHIECMCPGCNTVVAVGLEKGKNLEELCHVILGEVRKDKRKQVLRSKIMNKLEESLPKMKDEEVVQFVKFLQSTETHEEFMKEIGSDDLTPKDPPGDGKKDGSQD